MPRWHRRRDRGRHAGQPRPGLAWSRPRLTLPTGTPPPRTVRPATPTTSTTRAVGPEASPGRSAWPGRTDRTRHGPDV